jgi:hypothetical protein
MQNLSGKLLTAGVLATLTLAVIAVSARTVTESRRSDPPSTQNADLNAKKSLVLHDIGNVRMSFANWGEQGNPDGAIGFKGFEFPINSGNDFLFSAGVWVGAISNERRLVTTTTDGDNGTNEMYPVHIGTYPQANYGSSFGDWVVTSTTLDRLGDRYYVRGAKGVDDDGDWIAADDLDGNGKPSANWDGDSLDANHDGNPRYDPEPHMDEDPAGDISHDYIDNDFDGLVDLEDPDFDGDKVVGSLDDDGDGSLDEDGVARGAQEYFCVYQDDIEATYVGSPDADGHVPLQIQVSQRSYAYPEDYAADFILMDFRIRNIGRLTLRDVYIAMFSDPDIGARGEGGDAASLDDFNYYDPARLMMIQYDSPIDDDGPAPGIFAIRVVQTPAPLESLQVTFVNFERVAGGDPETNVDKYNMISSGSVSPPTPAAGDWRMLMGFGPSVGSWEIRPGQELPITIACIGGTDTADGAKNAEWALRLYNNDFQGPAAPNAPVFFTDYSPPGTVRISWLPNAEESIDPITQTKDFEGYLIERSFNQQDWHALAYYDLKDTLTGEFEWQNYNLGMPENIDSLGRYYFDDTDLIPGHTYYYVVRAFDKGVEGAGILTSSRTGNYQEIRTVRTEASGAPTVLRDIYVFPNPYKGSHPGEAGGEVNPSKGLIEYPRRIYFMNLPANSVSGRCKITIFSLAGDNLATLDHSNGTEQETWNLITKNRQEIVSGIYLYVVEYKADESTSWDRYMDKFVVIK